MGGGDRGKSVVEIVCQMCDQVGHIAIVCPWVYTRCKYVKCNGIMKLLISNQPQSAGEKFFTCHHPYCNGFKWFDDAMSSYVGSGSAEHLKKIECWGCGDPDHFMVSCPYYKSPCKKGGCIGVKNLRLSRTLHNYGVPYLKCDECDDFVWMSDVLTLAEKTKDKGNVRVSFELSVDELCQGIVKKVGMDN
ncbi:zinc finger protein [Macleaya cordata]|uniref:Zinc finger protein n=1 Tax=Macleaya cordata TaxID=56857 RepID=A0A200QT47_MACCD|nr:zinc finger protein [Macleaya cordata]OVA13612.1 zinc finger protein [Macleaya cordata]